MCTCVWHPTILKCITPPYIFYHKVIHVILVGCHYYPLTLLHTYTLFLVPYISLPVQSTLVFIFALYIYISFVYKCACTSDKSYLPSLMSWQTETTFHALLLLQPLYPLNGIKSIYINLYNSVLSSPSLAFLLVNMLPLSLSPKVMP